MDNSAYEARTRTISPYKAAAGFRLETVMHDYLHNIFLGTGRDMLASGIRVLLLKGVYDRPGVSDVDEKLSLLHAEMQETCRTNGLLGWSRCFFFKRKRFTRF